MKAKNWILAGGWMALVASPALALDITVRVKGEQLAFDPASFEVAAGEKVKLTFENTSKMMEHNLVLGQPGTAQKIGSDGQSAGPKENYVKKSPEVLAHTKMLKPASKDGKAQKDTLTFTAPSVTGDYPYVCTFPGHWVVMKGTMKVVPKK